MSTLIQRNMSGGELTPDLWPRTDTVKYTTGLRTLRNCFVGRHGGAVSRGGTNYVAEVKTSSLTCRTIPFQFNNSQTYVLEFGNLYMRIHTDGSPVLSAGVPYEIATPYLTADLATLDFVESADVITIVHPSYAPRELTRSGLTSWSLAVVSFAPSTAMPTSCAAAAGGVGAIVHRYIVTAVGDVGGEESLPGTSPGGAGISGVSNANPIVVTSTAHGFATGDNVYLTGIVGMSEIEGRCFIINANTANTFSLVGESGSTYSAYTSGGTAYLASCKISAAAPTSAAPNVITWSYSAGASEFNIYKEVSGLFGFIGSARGISFNDTGQTIDLTIAPPAFINPFNNTNKYPSAVSYIQQRLALANSNTYPTTGWMSQTGRFHNFSKSIPTPADGPIQFKMAGQQVNPIKFMIDLGQPLVFSEAGEWSLDGDTSGIIQPSAVNPKQHSYEGCSTLKPLIVSGDAIYVQALGSIVRNLAFNFQRGKYDGDDLSLFSSHLFEGYTIVDWAFQKVPYSIVWAVRSDGVLLSMTYIREHQIVGWARHDTNGTVENVCCVTEGEYTATYIVVKRTINGSTKRYVERMTDRRINDTTDIVDYIGMDCAISYDGRNTASTTMTLSGGSTWDETETLTLTASASVFVASDETYNNQIFLYDASGNIVRFTIRHYTSATVVTGLADRSVPATLQAIARTTWSKAVYHFSGLSHLEAKAVSVLADGYVVGSPNNAAYPTYTVASGAVVLDQPYAVVHIGLPFIADIETLDIDTPQGETIADKHKLVGAVTMHVKDSRGLFIGGVNPDDDLTNSDDDPLYNLTELKIRQYENDAPVALQTGKVTQNILPEWNSNGHVFIRQVDPLPMSILSIAPDGLYPFKGGG